MNCPICGEPMEYQGIEDGAGDYGDAVVETWYCETCGEYHDGDTWTVIEDEPGENAVEVWNDEDTTESAPVAPPSDDDVPF